MTLEQRIKQALILCDELWFEAGMVTLDVAEHFVMGPMWHPPHDLTDERIDMHRRAAKKGTPFVFRIGPEPAYGVPAPPEAMRTLGGGPRQRGFVGEFHQLLGRTKLIQQPWVHLGVTHPAADENIAAVEKQLKSFDFAYQREAPKLSKNHLLDGNLKSSLNHDLAVTAVTGLPAMIDRLHSRMLAYKAKNATANDDSFVPGAEALSLWIPDFTNRPWHDLIALHDHDAIGAFRAKLLDAEAEVAGLKGTKRKLALKEIGMREVTSALRKRFPTLREAALDVALDAVSGVVLGPAGALTTAVKDVAALRNAQSEWTAVYLSLRSRGAGGR